MHHSPSNDTNPTAPTKGLSTTMNPALSDNIKQSDACKMLQVAETPAYESQMDFKERVRQVLDVHTIHIANLCSRVGGSGEGLAAVDDQLEALRYDILSVTETNVADLADAVREKTDSLILASDANQRDIDSALKKTDTLALAVDSVRFDVASLEQESAATAASIRTLKTDCASLEKCVDMTETSLRVLETKYAALQDTSDAAATSTKRKFLQYEGEMRIMMAKIDALAGGTNTMDMAVVHTARSAEGTMQVEVLTPADRRVKVAYPGSAEFRMKV